MKPQINMISSSSTQISKTPVVDNFNADILGALGVGKLYTLTFTKLMSTKENVIIVNSLKEIIPILL